MNNLRKLTWVLPALLLAACNSKANQECEPMETQTAAYHDTTKLVVVDLSLELPTGTDAATLAIRDSLIQRFAMTAEWSFGFSEEDEKTEYPAYTGDLNDLQAFVDHYGKEDTKCMMRDVLEEAKMSESDLANLPADAELSMWGYDVQMEKAVETADYVVFHTRVYGYSGGAHGWFSAPNPMTFDRHTGHMITEFVNRDEAAPKIQPLIRQGLLSYFNQWDDEEEEQLTDDDLDDRLMLNEDASYIPLPYDTSYPNATGDSLIFTYSEYEITCYADGMPTFALAVKDLKPYLTEEGKAMMVK